MICHSSSMSISVDKQHGRKWIRKKRKLKEQENQIKKKDYNKTIKPKCNRFQQFRYEYEDDETDDKVLQDDNTINRWKWRTFTEQHHTTKSK